MSVLERALRKASRTATERTEPDGGSSAAAELKRLKRRPALPARTASADPSFDGPVHEVTQQMLADAGFVVEEHAERLRNEFRRIKRPVLSNAFGDESLSAGPSQLVMTTSAVPGDGKSFVAMNLALSVAREQDRKVVLVDADVPRRTLTNALRLANAPGLMELLTVDGTSVSDVVRRTSIDGLSVLPSGTHERDAPELFSSARMKAALQELSTRYPDRIVLFDTPPLLASAEALALSEHVGQVLFVVRAGVTGQRAVQQALEMLDRTKAINIVLNGAPSMPGDGYYNYDDYCYPQAAEVE